MGFAWNAAWALSTKAKPSSPVLLDEIPTMGGVTGLPAAGRSKKRRLPRARSAAAANAGRTQDLN